MDARGPNAEQIEFWTAAGPRWVAQQAMLDAQLDELGRLALDALDPPAGGHVVDVGCGCGHSLVQLARRVGPDGHVLGVDVSAPMLARAAERLREDGIAHVTLLRADAQTHAFAEQAADGVFSRFGVMFFADPASAFANLARALRPGGRMTFVCWQSLDRNPWMLVPVQAAAAHVAMPPPPPPGTPGPFSLGDRERVRRLLREAGLSDVAVDAHEGDLAVAGAADLERTTDFVLQLSLLARVLQQADPQTVARVRDAVREALAPYARGDGVRMPSAAWIVGARRP